MLRSCVCRPLGRCFGSWNGDGLMWNMDLKHASGDFSIAVVQANDSLEDQSQVFTSPSATYVGVYDGHGGPEASRFVNKHLFPYLNKFVSEQGGLSADVIRMAFSATEEEFLHVVKRSLPARPEIASVGSCCLVGAISDGVLYVANLGDSRAVLGRRASDGRKNRVVVAERLSTDHNVCVEEVRREVEALHPDDAHVVVYTRGVWRIKGIIQEVNNCQDCDCGITCFASYSNHFLQLDLKRYICVHVMEVSRSIGDVYLKKPEFNRDPIFQRSGNPISMKRPLVTAEPSIVIRKLMPEDSFLIFASDGLWEQLTDQAAVEIVFNNPKAGIAKRLVRAALHNAAKKREMSYGGINRIEKGIRRHFHDDITVIVIYLDHHKTAVNRRPKHSTIDSIINAPMDILA